MQGISKSKHEHLMLALQQLEQLMLYKESLNSNIEAEYVSKDALDCREFLEAAIQGREELHDLYTSYNTAIENLAVIITKYEALYSHLRTGYVGNKLKELKRDMSADDEQLQLLKESIRNAYGI